MSQRRSYPNSGDFNLDDLFRPEPQGQPGQPQFQGQPGQPQGHSAVPPVGQPSGQPEYLGEGGHALPGQSVPGHAVPGQSLPGHSLPGHSVPGMPSPGQAMPAPGASWGGQQPGYGVPQAEPAPETQYLPPYPVGDPQAGGYPAPQAQPGYPQPQPAPGYPAYPVAAQPQQAYPAQEYQPGYSQGGNQGYTGDYGQDRGPDPDATQAGGSGRGRPSSKLIIGGVVAGCAAAGVLVAVLVSGGGGGETTSDKKNSPVAAGSTSAPGTASASGSGAAVDPDVKAQAQPLSDLLGTASDSRSSVVSAVASVQKCDKLPESQQALTAAAGKRRELQSKLGQLKTDKLPGGQQLVEQLNAAWTASAQADDEYAAWAQDAQGSCDAKKQDNQHYKNAVQASGTATTAKKQAATLWNTIAGQSGLPNRGDGDL
ncbi:hypothetical protein ACFQ6N_09200 [Kitasatospora sp. NPDC056446]|uniref:hypothetical protein n=1 Tax=Kitasatospora sp. NPDC056446 TaxID=3345819 RepID=UPI0036B2D3B1